MFSILIEPTTEKKYQVPVNGQLIPCRIWRGTTPSGIEVEAYVVSIVPLHEHDTAHLAAELPAMMRPSREVYDIDVGGETREDLDRRLARRRCRYPDCDGGPQTGYCHVDCRRRTG